MKVVFAENALGRISEFVPDGNVLIVTSAGGTLRGWTSTITDALGPRAFVYDGVIPNPGVENLDVALGRIRSAAITGIIGVGGGSSIDSAKALALGLTFDDAEPFSAIVRDGATLSQVRAPVPVTAVPTTAGSGAEVTPFATVWDTATGRKASLVGPGIQPTTAILDPALTVTLDETGTLFPALDALSHALESIWNLNRTPISHAFSIEALHRLLAGLPAALGDPFDIAARTNMQNGSLLAGMAISQTRTALAHAISYPLTARYGVPHGLACSFTLPVILDHGLADLRAVMPNSLLQKISNLLRTLRLSERLRAYVSVDDALALIPEMVGNDRAANLIWDVDVWWVRDLLVEALNESPTRGG